MSIHYSTDLLNNILQIVNYIVKERLISISIIITGLIAGMLPGVFGNGGSIITMPALLYLLDIEPKSAIAMSLGIVCLLIYPNMVLPAFYLWWPVIFCLT